MCVRVQVSMKVTVNEYVCECVIVMEFVVNLLRFFSLFILYFRRGCELNSAIYGSKNTVKIARNQKQFGNEKSVNCAAFLNGFIKFAQTTKKYLQYFNSVLISPNNAIRISSREGKLHSHFACLHLYC